MGTSNTSLKLTTHTLYLIYIYNTMSYKVLFIFGLLAAAAWTQPLPDQDLSEEEVLPSADANAKVVFNFGDLKCDDENVEKVEKVVKTENGVSAHASVKVKVPMKKFVFGSFKCDDENSEQDVDEKVVKDENVVPACAAVSVKKIDAEEMKKFLEEFNARWEKLKKQVEENKNTVKCENSEENQDVVTDEDKKSPFKFSFQVCSRASAKASATATSGDCSNEEAKPATDEKFVAGKNGDVVAVLNPVIADQPAAEQAVEVQK